MAVFVHSGQIAGMKPAVHHGLGRGLGFVPVAGAEHVAANEEFAFLSRGPLPALGPDQFNVHMGHGMAHGFQFSVGHEKIGTRFGQPVSLPEMKALLLLEGLKNLLGERRPPGNQKPNTRQVDAGKPRRFDHHVIHGGHGEKDRNPFPFDQVQDQVGLETVDKDVGPQAVEQGEGEDVPARCIEQGRMQDGPLSPAADPSPGGS